MHQYAQPGKFFKISTRILPWCALLSLVLIGMGLYGGLLVAPPDYQQGESVRIMYVHVPSAWLSVMVYAGIAIASAMFLVWRHPLADVIARASAPIGASFTFITLVTGSLWGKPMWGTWWVWDARLTSVLILFFMYLGYIAIQDAFDSEERGKKAAAALALIGAVNLPIIKFSVDWWNTLHQPASILRMGGPTIHSSMLWPLLLMIAGFTMLYLTLLILRSQSILTETKIRRLQFRER